MCPSSEEFCGAKDIKIAGYKEFEIAALPQNHICKYNVQIDNKSFDKIFHLTINNRQSVEAGMYYRSRWLDNKGHTEIGTIGEGTCQIKRNCTLDSTNLYNYYLSNTQEVSIIVMADPEPQPDEPSLLQMEMDLMAESNDQISLYII